MAATTVSMINNMPNMQTVIITITITNSNYNLQSTMTVTMMNNNITAISNNQQ